MAGLDEGMERAYECSNFYLSFISPETFVLFAPLIIALA